MAEEFGTPNPDSIPVGAFDLPLPDPSSFPDGYTIADGDFESNGVDDFSPIFDEGLDPQLYDPQQDIEYKEPTGWSILSRDVPSLKVMVAPALAFFPNSSGVIEGVMPTLQATGIKIDRKNGSDEFDWPVHTLEGSKEYYLYLLYDSTNDTCRAYFELIATDINTVKVATEEAIKIAYVKTSGNEVEKTEHYLSGPEAVGGGGGAAKECYPFDILTSKPNYVLLPEDRTPPEAPYPPLNPGEVEFWIRHGEVNQRVPTEINDRIVVDEDKYLVLKINIVDSSHVTLRVTSVDVVLDSFETPTLENPLPPPAANGTQDLPTHVYYRLGVIRADGTFLQYGKGNIDVFTNVSNIILDGQMTTFRRQIRYRRDG